MSNGHNLTLFNLFILLILLRWNIYQYAESTCRVKWEMLFFGGLKLFVNLLIFFFWERFIVTKAFQPGCWSMPNHFGLQGQYSRETTVITQVLFRGLENVVIKSQDRIYLRIYLRNISDTCDWGREKAGLLKFIQKTTRQEQYSSQQQAWLILTYLSSLNINLKSAIQYRQYHRGCIFNLQLRYFVFTKCCGVR